MPESFTPNIYPWLRNPWEQVLQSLQQQRTSHAWLISGPEGLGKTHFSEHFAQLLLCTEASMQIPCGRCKSCRLLIANNHPDVLTLAPEAKDKQIKIDDVRAANEFMHQTAQQGGNRVLVINPVEAMNIHASNALLKTLEEPGRGAYLILVTHMLSQLIPTIRSRCRRLDIVTPPLDEARQWLVEQSFSAADVEEALAIAGGRPVLAKQLIDDDNLKLFAHVLEQLQSIENDAQAFIDIAKEWAQQDSHLLVHYLISILKSAIEYQLIANKKVALDTQRQRLSYQLAEKSQPLRLFGLYQTLLSVKEQLMSKANINRVLLFENLLLQWQRNTASS